MTDADGRISRLTIFWMTKASWLQQLVGFVGRSATRRH